MSLKNHSLKQEPAEKVITAVEAIMPAVEAMSESDLQELRHQVDLRLFLDLGQLNLAEELALQFRQSKALLNEIAHDKSITTSQKAQILNSARSQLSDIVKQQAEVWNMERLKKYEVAFVKASNALTAEAKVLFFDLYGKYLKDAHANDAVNN